MDNPALFRLQYLLQIIPPLLEAISEADLSLKIHPNKWSKKEILGHLIDSATNNHQRFIRAQFEETPVIAYNQNEWNRCSFYNEIPKHQLITFWIAYNQHLSSLIELMPSPNFQKFCRTTGPEPHTLEFLFNDYVSHLEHHLKQLVTYNT